MFFLLIIIFICSFGNATETFKRFARISNNSSTFNLQKRGFHEEAPLFYVEDRHPAEFFWSEPYYPSRMYIICLY